MTTVLLVVQLMIAIALIGVVLLQRSEGGALGMGGGGAGGFLTGRGTANLLTRTTALLGMAFFANSILLTLLARHGNTAGSVFDPPAVPAASGPATPGPATPALPGAAPPSPTGGDAAKPDAAKPDATRPSDTAPRGGILDKLQKESR